METLEPTLTETMGMPVEEPEQQPARGPGDWLRRNLFRSWVDGAVTVIATIVLGYAVFRLGRFVLVSGRWRIIRSNLGFFMYGRYPRDELWRITTAVCLIAVYAGVVAGYVHRHRISGAEDHAPVSAGRRTIDIVTRFWPLLLGVAVLLSLTGTAGPAIVTALVILSAVAGRLAGQLLSKQWLLPIIAVGLAGPPLLVWFLAEATGWDGWGGMMLNVVLAAVGIALSFPLGVLLALGRRAGRRTESRTGGIVVAALLAAAPLWILVARGFDATGPMSWALVGAIVVLGSAGYFIGRASTLPLVRIVSVAYIEFFRGVPLFVLLLLGGVALGFFLPTGVDTPGLGVRAIIVITLFTAAYIAEIVRGGLQSLPRGQTEAAQALGLSPVKTTGLIVLPQALRNVIPAIVGQFISLYKDTTLIGAAMGLFEMLNVAGAATSSRTFFGQGLAPEAWAFVTFAFWVGCITMSRESQRLERKLGVGTR